MTAGARIIFSLLMTAALTLCFSTCVGPPDRGTTNRGITRVQEPLEECCSNLKNIATALEMYAADNQGNYPTSLTALTPAGSSPGKTYLKSIPTCPGSRTDYGYAYSKAPDRFTLWCATGGTHSDRQEVPKDGCWPQYTSTQSLIMKP
jgi:hypothetical protein